MGLHFTLAVTVSALAAAGANAAPDTRTVIYRTPFNPPASSGDVYDLANKLTGPVGGHVVWHFKTCEESSPYNCLYADEIDFALSVPKQGMLEGSTWRIGKYRFVISHGGLMHFAGRQLSYSVIDMTIDGAPQDQAHISAMYDPKFGLVCYAYLNWKDPGTGKDRPYATIEGTACAEDIGLWPRGK
jgi:hypothetical protein